MRRLRNYFSKDANDILLFAISIGLLGILMIFVFFDVRFNFPPYVVFPILGFLGLGFITIGIIVIPLLKHQKGEK